MMREAVGQFISLTPSSSQKLRGIEASILFEEFDMSCSGSSTSNWQPRLNRPPVAIGVSFYSPPRPLHSLWWKETCLGLSLSTLKS
eukprot:763293-Hanusia_phi.AAC.2